MLEKSIAFAAESCKNKISLISKKPYILQVMESVVIMSDIEQKDKELIATESLLRLYEYSCTTLEEIEKNFGSRIKSMVAAASVKDLESTRRLPLKIKMLVLAQKLADLRCIQKEYEYYRENLWQRLPEQDPNKLAKYYYSLSDIFFEFEEYPAFSEFNNLTAKLFVKYR